MLARIVNWVVLLQTIKMLVGIKRSSLQPGKACIGEGLVQLTPSLK